MNFGQSHSEADRLVHKVVLVVGALAALACASLAVDLSVQQAATTHRPPGVVRDYFKATETFGNGFGAAMVVLAVIVLDRSRRVQTGRLLAASLGAGIVANVVKLMVARTRPHATDIESLLADGGRAWDTFVGVLPMGALGAAGQSFPSAHTATAFGLAAALAITYPKGRRLFYSFAAGVALQRICTGAHYLSDVLAGAAVGIAWGGAVCGFGPICRWFDRLEAWWADRFGWSRPVVSVEASGDAVIPMPSPRVGTPVMHRRAA